MRNRLDRARGVAPRAPRSTIDRRHGPPGRPAAPPQGASPGLRPLPFAAAGLLLLAALPVGALTGLTEQKVTASDAQALDVFSAALDVKGGTAVIASPHEDDGAIGSGAAYVFEVDALGRWTETQRLKTPIPATEERFAGRVALDATDLFLGAPGNDDAGDNAGAAYVYRPAGTGWAYFQKIVPAGLAPGDTFGGSLSVGSPVGAVGASRDDTVTTNAGAVYVYELDAANVWVQVAKLTTPDGTSHAYFGSAVDVSGTTLAVGAYGQNVAGWASGAVYVYERAGGVWTQTAKLTAGADAMKEHLFGHAVALDGDTLVATASFDADQGDRAGAVYVFERTGGTWTQVQKLYASDASPGARFGGAVDLDADRLLVGSIFGSDGPGAAYVFERDPLQGWVERAVLKGSDTSGSPYVGNHVALDGTTALISAQGDDEAGTNAGAAYFYTCAGSVC